MHRAEDIAQSLLGTPLDRLDKTARRVAHHIAGRKHITRDLVHETEAEPRFGQRAADAVARFGGSWTFVVLFAATIAGWTALNALLMRTRGTTFDPYPYILLNLFLSMLAAVQAPVILMSQNRQSEKDRLHAEHDYEVNLKAELEIMLLHEKIDQLSQTQWNELLALQRQQLALLARLADGAAPRPAGA